MRAGAPIVPDRRRRRRGGGADLRPASSVLQRLTGLLYFPLTPTFPHGGLARHVRLPAGQVQASASSSRSRPTQWGDEPWKDAALVQTVARTSAALIQEELYEMLGQARARSGSDELAPDPRHRPLDLLGRPAGPGARARASGRGDHRRRRPRPDGRARAHRVRARRHQHALLRRIVQAAEIDTVVDTRLVVDSTTTSPRARAREQRHRDDEHPRRLQRARNRPVRKVVFKSSAH